MPVAAPSYAQAPVWSPSQNWSTASQWAAPLQPIDPPNYYTPPVMQARRRRSWRGVKFVLFLGVVGLIGYAARDHLPRSLSEAQATWASLTDMASKLRNRLEGSKGDSAPVAGAPAAASGPHASRGPEIVPIPTVGQAAPTRGTAPRLAPRPEPAPSSAGEPGAARGRVLVPSRPSHLVAALSPPSPAPVRPAAPRKAAGDPFEDDAAAAAALAKPLRTPVAAAAREVPPSDDPAAAPAPRVAPAERPAVAAKPAQAERADRAERPERPAPKGSLDDLMNTAVAAPVKKPARPNREGREIDRRLAGFNEVKDEQPRKKLDEPPPVHALTRTEVQTVMRGVEANVRECYKQFHVGGPADVKVSVGEDGTVKSLTLSGPFTGTPTGSCVERFVKAATFPPSAGLRFDYRLSVR
jgi:hypothetical protein